MEGAAAIDPPSPLTVIWLVYFKLRASHGFSLRVAISMH
jgi:hypothetical protein